MVSRPPSGHRIARVDGQVEDRGLELAGVGMDAPQAAGQHGLEPDGLAERAAQQVGDAADELVGVDRLGRQRLLAREGQQPLRQRGRALRAVDRRIDELAHVGLAALQAALEQVEGGR